MGSVPGGDVVAHSPPANQDDETTALLYSEHGTYVYRQLDDAGADTFHYAAVAVRPLARVGSAWLVDGLERTDRVVVEGAGVLWSQQGIGTFSAAEEEHD